MKIAVVTTRHAPQDDRIFHKEALSLAKRMEVTLIAQDDGVKRQWPESVRFQPLPWRRSPVGRVLSLLEAVREVRRGEFDACHFHDLDLVFAAPLLRFATGALLVYDSHEVFTRHDLVIGRRFPRVLGGLIAKAVEDAEFVSAHFCDHVVTAVEPGDVAFRNLRVPVTTVYNFPPLNLFETSPEALEKEKQRFGSTKPLIYHGTMSASRGLFHMIDALEPIVRQQPDVRLRLVGLANPALDRRARTLAAKRGVESHLEIIPWLPHQDVAYAIKSSRIGLVPLQAEEKYKRALPIKLLEYMACGIPVVAADLPLMASFVKEADAGIVYDSSRPDELARCVVQLLSDPEGCARLGENGRRAVQERWNWSKMEEVLFEVYAKLQSARATRRGLRHLMQIALRPMTG